MSNHRVGTSPTPRPLTDNERGALRAILEYSDFDGRDMLLAAVDDVQVVGRCGCGCATVDLRGPGDSGESASFPTPNEADVLNEHGDCVGGVLVFVAEGRLRQLEVYSHSEEPISEMPGVDRLRLHVVPR